MERHRVLLIEGNVLEGAALRAGLCARGFDAREVTSAESALGLLPSFAPGVVIADASLPGLEAGAVVARLRALRPETAVVVTAPRGRLEAAVSGMRAGADALVAAPLDAGQVALVLEKALESRSLVRERAALRRELREQLVVVGESPEVAAAVEVVARAGPTQAAVLVQGEPGTGRTHFGAVIHEASPRRAGPLVRVPCAGVSELWLESRLFGHEAGAFDGAEARSIGAIEQAEGGTLFLEEVHRLPVSTQVKLLRLLQGGELERLAGRSPIQADVRVIAAASGDLAEEVRAGRFRADLYYRLAVVTVFLPPLRARKADLPALATHLLTRHSRQAGREVDSISPGALSALFGHDWPGNVRELSTELEQAVHRTTGREIGAGDLSHVLVGSASGDIGALIPGASLFEIERDAILRTLERVGGSSVRAAELLGVSVRKIQYRLREYRSGSKRRIATHVALS
jgi:two-component system NtrC family response regulator